MAVYTVYWHAFVWPTFTTVGQYYNEMLRWDILSQHITKNNYLSLVLLLSKNISPLSLDWFSCLLFFYLHIFYTSQPELTLCMWSTLSSTHSRNCWVTNQSINQSALRLKSRDSRTVVILKWSLTEYWVVLLVDTQKDFMCPRISGLSRGCRRFTKGAMFIQDYVRDLLCI